MVISVGVDVEFAMVATAASTKAPERLAIPVNMTLERYLDLVILSSEVFVVDKAVVVAAEKVIPSLLLVPMLV
jgi:hypothetical protein